MANDSRILIGDRGVTARRVLAVLVVAMLFVASWFVSGPQFVRAYAAFVPVAVLMFAVELTADARHKLSKRERWYLRRAPVSKIFSWRRFCAVLLNVSIALSALFVLLQIRHPSSTGMSALRWAVGLVLFYALVELVFEIGSLCCLLAGYSLPALHRTPIAARSVGEFWGQRWNIIVSAWLRTFVFRPLARRRIAGIGVFCCFFVSGVFHAWPMLVALGISAALSTMAFFVIQGITVLAENRLSIHTWPVAVARAWTLVMLLASSPLLTDPGLRLFGF